MDRSVDCKGRIVRRPAGRPCRPLLMTARGLAAVTVRSEPPQDYDGPSTLEAPMSDKSILDHISTLVEEEHRLTAEGKDPAQDAERLRHIGEQLDQCWDLLL